MIRCVSFADFEEFLIRQGFVEVGRVEPNILYARPDKLLTVHQPNQNGDVTELAVEEARNAAGINPPSLDLHWCD